MDEMRLMPKAYEAPMSSCLGVKESIASMTKEKGWSSSLPSKSGTTVSGMRNSWNVDEKRMGMKGLQASFAQNASALHTFLSSKLSDGFMSSNRSRMTDDFWR